jgi:hypothetical protein
VFEIGPGGRLLVGGLASFALVGLGWLLFGIASIRAGVFPAAISIGIALSGLLSGVPISGAYLFGHVLLGLALISLGVWMLRTRTAAHEASQPVPA